MTFKLVSATERTRCNEFLPSYTEIQSYKGKTSLVVRSSTSPILPALFLPAHDLALKVEQVGCLEPADDDAPKSSRWREHASEMRVRRQGGVVLQEGERALRDHT